MLILDYGWGGVNHTHFTMLWDINFLLFCVNMYIAKRQYEGIKKVELILVKTRVFSIITSTSGEAYSNDGVIQVGGLTNDYGWLRGRCGVSKMAKKVLT